MTPPGKRTRSPRRRSSETSPPPSPRSGGSALRAVVDTNVWVSALISPIGAPRKVLLAAQARRFELVVSWDLAEEVAEVLRRPSLQRYGITEQDVTDVITIVAPFLPDVEVDVPIRDLDDTAVVIAALAGRADVIVTGDNDLLEDVELVAWLADRGVDVVSPSRFLELLGSV